jgi:hypothetical protein
MSDVYHSLALAHSKWDCKSMLCSCPNGGEKLYSGIFAGNWGRLSHRKFGSSAACEAQLSRRRLAHCGMLSNSANWQRNVAGRVLNVERLHDTVPQHKGQYGNVLRH